METITPQQMEKIDANSENLGVPRLLLMENAGRAVADYLKRRFGDLVGRRVVVVAGTGNNGGDGFVAARHLAGYGADVTVILLGREEFKTDEASLNWRGLKNMIKTVKLVTMNDASFEASLEKLILNADMVVDAVFGTGVRGRIREPYSTAIEQVNRSKAYTLSVDIPSGLDPLTGEVHDKSVVADATVTFHKAKTGLMKRLDLAGEVVVASIGVPPESEEGV